MKSQQVWDGDLNREDINLGTVQYPEDFCQAYTQKLRKGGNEADAEKDKERQETATLQC